MQAMLWRVGAVTLALAIAGPARAQSDLESGFVGALRGCEAWVLEPAAWADGLDEFASKIGLGNKAGWVQSVEDVALPPKEFRVANHYLRINSTANAGYILVVSDRIPFCHITGGGGTDLEPTVEAVLASDDFKSRWERVKDQSMSDMASTEFRNKDEPKFEIVISRAKKPGERQDRVQVLATAIYQMSR
jgi:hypothetical protein